LTDALTDALTDVLVGLSCVGFVGCRRCLYWRARSGAGVTS
jgi:hypothetical protein